MSRDDAVLRAATDAVREHKAALTADVGRLVGEHLAYVRSNQPQPVTVTVDMAPVAEAIDRMSAALEKVLAALMKMPAPVVNVAAPDVRVAAPVVNVEAAKPRSKRALKIIHDDGTHSTVTEE